MAAKGPELKGRIGIDGEQEFKDAITKASASIRVIDSDLSVLSAQFKAGQQSMELYQKKNETLTAKVEAQRAKVATMTDVLAAVKAKYGDNSTEADKYTIKLNQAIAALTKTEGELTANQTAMDAYAASQEAGAGAAEQLSGAADAAGDAVKDEGDKTSDAAGKHDRLKAAMGAAGDMAKGALVAGATAAAAAIAAVGAAAAAAVVEAGKLAVSAGTFADDLLTQSIQTGVSTQELQKWSYAANFIDTDVDTMTSSMGRMTKAMGDAAGGSTSAADKFSALGVSITDSDGSMRDAQDVFADAIDALGNVQNETERDALAMDLFGKSARDLNPLIEAGGDALKSLGEEAEATGNVISDDMLASMGSFDDSMQRAKAGANTLKTVVGATLMPVFQPFADAATGAMSQVSLALMDGLQPGELDGIVDSLLTTIGGLVTNLSTTITQAMPLVSQALTGIIGTLVTALPGLIDTLLPAAMSLLQSVLDAILANIDPLVTMATSLITSIGTFLIQNAPLLLDAAIGIVSGLVSSITEQLPTLIPMAVTMLATLATDLIAALPTLMEQLPTIVQAIWDGLAAVDWISLGINLITGLVNGLTSAVSSLLESIITIFANIWSAILGVFGIASPSTEAQSAAGYIFQGFLDGFTNGLGAVLDAVAEIFGKVWNAIKSIFGFGGGESDESKEAKTAGADIMSGMQTGIEDQEETLKTAVAGAAQLVLDTFITTFGISDGSSSVTKDYGTALGAGVNTGLSGLTESSFAVGASSMATAAATALNSAFGLTGTGFLGLGEQSASKFEYIGAAIAKGVATGITDNASTITSAAVAAAKAAYDAAKSELGIHSPSRKMAEVGRYYDLGFAEGIRGGTMDVTRAAASLSVAATTSTAATTARQTPAIDYTKLAQAMAQANVDAGLGNTTMMLDGEVVGTTITPTINRCSRTMRQRTISGRTTRMVMV